jgi:hypothetical protein
LNVQRGQLPDKVDRWCISDQKQRWGASALSLTEPRHQWLPPPQLRAALQTMIRKAERVEGTRIEE